MGPGMGIYEAILILPKIVLVHVAFELFLQLELFDLSA